MWVPVTSSEVLGVTPQFTRLGFLNRSSARPPVRVRKHSSRGCPCGCVCMGVFLTGQVMGGGLPVEGAQLAATPREGYGTHPNNLKGFLLPPPLDPVIFSQSQPPCSTAKLEWKVKNKGPPTPQKGKGKPTRKAGGGGAQGRGFGPSHSPLGPGTSCCISREER